MTLTAYLDESGHNDKLLVMGGFVSTPEKWLEFSKECDLIKAHFHIPYIHAAELFSPKSTRHYGHLNLGRRREVLGCLMSAIIDHAELSAAVTVIPRLYDSLTTNQWRSKHGSSYAGCVNGFLIGLVGYLDISQGETLALNLFLEDGHAHANEAEEMIRDYKAFYDESDVPVLGGPAETVLSIGDYGLIEKGTASPLWAADLICYCTYNQIMRHDPLCTEIMETLHERVSGFGVCLGRKQIEAMIESAADAEKLKREWQADMHHNVRYLYQFGITAHKEKRGVMFDFTGMSSVQKENFMNDTKAKFPEG